jgi:hydroxymethylglutaryl-CoA lyase
VSAVRIRDVSPRLALQACNVSTSRKVELIERLIAAGIRAIEVSSFVNPKLVPGLADAERVFAQIPRRAEISLECCVGNRRGLARAIDAGADAAWFLLAADAAFSLANIGMSIDASLEELKAMRALAEAHGIRLGTYIIATWGGPIGRSRQPRDLESLFKRLVEIGVREWILADSFGYAGPIQMRDMIDFASGFIDRQEMIVQIHDSRGLGLANAVELVAQGVSQIDAALAGSGSHPALPPEQQVGGLCIEDLVQMLDLMGINTGIDLPRLIETANWLEEIVGIPGRGFVRRVGSVPMTDPAADLRADTSQFNWRQ